VRGRSAMVIDMKLTGNPAAIETVGSGQHQQKNERENRKIQSDAPR
jgi:hypothetical protein